MLISAPRWKLYRSFCAFHASGVSSRVMVISVALGPRPHIISASPACALYNHRLVQFAWEMFSPVSGIADSLYGAMLKSVLSCSR